MAESTNKQLLSALTEGHEKALRSSARTSNSNFRSSETTKQQTTSSKKNNNSIKEKSVGSAKCE